MPSIKNDYIYAMGEALYKDKLKLTKSKEKEIVKMYDNAIRDLANQLRKSNGVTKKIIRNKMRGLFRQLEKLNIEGVTKAAALSMQYHINLMNEIGYQAGVKTTFESMFANIPSLVLETMKKGSIYKDGAGLSQRIWNITKQSGKQIEEIIYNGIANGTSADKLAKLLEEHVNPAVKKYWNNDKIKELLGDGYAWANKNIEYNALRLARTSISHSFTLGNKLAAKRNPYVTKFKWHSAFAHGRTCSICKDRDGRIYTIAKLPYDHPNGLCWEEPYYEHDLEYYANDIRNWLDGEPNSKLDKWYKEWYNPDWKPQTKKSVDKMSNILYNNKNKVPVRRERRWRRFMDYNEIEEWENRRWRPRCEQLRKENYTAYDALETYTGSEYKYINRYLRGQEDANDYIKNVSDNIKNFLSKQQLGEDVVVYRGASHRAIGNYSNIDDAIDNAKELIGKVVEDKGFMSTSVSKDRANRFAKGVIFEIKVPAEAPAMYIAPLSNFKTEKELLLNAGTKLLITDVENGYPLKIIAEVVVE